MTCNTKQLKSYRIFGETLRNQINQAKCESQSCKNSSRHFSHILSLRIRCQREWQSRLLRFVPFLADGIFTGLIGRITATSGFLFVPRIQSCNVHMMLFVIRKHVWHCATRESPSDIAPYRCHLRSMCRLRVDSRSRSANPVRDTENRPLCHHQLNIFSCQPVV